MTTLVFSPKDPAESLVYEMDFVRLLAAISSTETIVSATTSFVMLSWTADATPPVAVGDPVVVDTAVRQRISGGAAGSKCRVEILVVTSSGATVVGSVNLAIVDGA